MFFIVFNSLVCSERHNFAKLQKNGGIINLIGYNSALVTDCKLIMLKLFGNCSGLNGVNRCNRAGGAGRSSPACEVYTLCVKLCIVL